MSKNYKLLMWFIYNWYKKKKIIRAAILKAVEDGNFTFDDPDWSEVSNEAKDLIRKMLEKDPKKRISAKESYEHPWVQ